MAEAALARHAAPVQRQRAQAELDAVSNGALHALKENEAAEEKDHDHGGGDEHHRPGRLATTGERPAESVNHAGHRVETIEPTPALRHQRAWIGDGRSEHPELYSERNDGR